MRGRTNLPKGVIYKEKETESTPLNLIWKPNALTTTDDLIKIIYETGYFVILGKNGTVSYSADGKYFVTKKLGNYTFKDIYYYDGKFYAVGYIDDDGVVAVSDDLKEWNVETYEGKQFRGICHNGKNFVLFTAKNHTANTAYYSVCFLRTTDFEEFEETAIKNSVNPNYYQFLYRNNRIILVFYDPAYTPTTIEVSDGEIINNSAQSLNRVERVVEANGYLFYSTGDYLQSAGMPRVVEYGTSVSGLTWNNTKKTVSAENLIEYFPPKFMAAIHFNYYYLAFTDKKTVLIMSDLSEIGTINNSELKLITSSIVNDVAVSESGIVAVCDGGEIYTASVDVDDRKMEIIPGEYTQEIYIRQSDNIRKIIVRGK